MGMNGLIGVVIIASSLFALAFLALVNHYGQTSAVSLDELSAFIQDNACHLEMSTDQAKLAGELTQSDLDNIKRACERRAQGIEVINKAKSAR